MAQLNDWKTLSVRVLGRVAGELAAVYSVPRGSRLYWSAQFEPDLVDPSGGRADIALRRGNELIQFIKIKVPMTAGSSTDELPSLSPGTYTLELKVFGPNSARPAAMRQWQFDVKDSASEIQVAQSEGKYVVAG